LPLTELRQNELATSARALQIRGYKFDWQEVEWLTVVIRGPVGVYLLLRGRWASGSRHVVGLATDARCMAVSRPLFCAFDDRTLITSRPVITFVILFWLVAGEAPSNKSSSTSRHVSLGGTHTQY